MNIQELFNNAIINGDFETVQTLLQSNQININESNLIDCIKFDYIDILKLLLSLTTNPLGKDNMPLIIAVKYKRYEIIDILLNIDSLFFNTPTFKKSLVISIKLSIKLNDPISLNKLMQVEKLPYSTINLLYVKVIEHGNLELVNVMRDYDIDVRYDNDKPFQTALIKGYIDIMKTLLRFDNIDIEQKDYKFFFLALQLGNIEVINLLWTNMDTARFNFKNATLRGKYHRYAIQIVYDSTNPKLIKYVMEIGIGQDLNMLLLALKYSKKPWLIINLIINNKLVSTSNIINFFKYLIKHISYEITNIVPVFRATGLKLINFTNQVNDFPQHQLIKLSIEIDDCESLISFIENGKSNKTYVLKYIIYRNRTNCLQTFLSAFGDEININSQITNGKPYVLYIAENHRNTNIISLLQNKYNI